MATRTITTGPAFFIGTNAHTAATLRKMVRALCGHKEAVDDINALKVAQSGTTQTFTVSVGGATIIAATDSIGDYAAVLDTAQNITFTGEGGGTRIDLVCIRVYDTDLGDSYNEYRLEVIEGTPGGGTPATPSYAIPLATISVPTSWAGGSALTVTDLRRTRTQQVGGIMVGISSADMPSATEGDFRYDADTDRIRYYDGAAWKMLPGKRIGFCLTATADNIGVSGSWDDVLFDTEEFDTDAFIAVPGRLATISSTWSGLWMFAFTVEFSGNATGIRAAGMELDTAGSAWGGGTPEFVGGSEFSPSATVETRLSATFIKNITTADQRVRVCAYQTSGSGLNANARFTGIYLGSI